VSPASSKPSEGRRRVQVDAIRPHVDRGRFPVKGVAGDSFRVEADVFGDSHDRIRVQLLYRRRGTRRWSETPMIPKGNDLWEASFLLEEPGAYQYTVEGWVDALLTWRTELAKWIDAGVKVPVELREGALLLEAAAERAQEDEDDAEALRLWVRQLREWADDPSGRGAPAELAVAPGLLEGELPRLMERYPDRSRTTRPRRTLGGGRSGAGPFQLLVRVLSPVHLSRTRPPRHLRRRPAMLPYIREMGFDVVYLPPIHPVGRTNGRDRTTG
jgi:starch synthase (maltosyl-transferring)